MDCKKIWTMLEGKKEVFNKLSDQIWEYAELRYKEFKSADLQKKFLKDVGFEVTDSIGGIETAFEAHFGSGKPVIAFLGEYDALPNLSQTQDKTEHSPVKQGMPGHGCGHNLLGTAALEAAYVTAQMLKKNNHSGTIRYYGCPAEESGAGKAFMVRAGCFDNVDAALSWHPGPQTNMMNNTLANARILYEFHGISSHASAAPHLGRSALDALELMNVGANFLREHIIPEARIHYAILDAGGTAPNVVQDYAKALYVVRAPHNSQLKEITERVHALAEGAAMMTGTRTEYRIVSAYANVIKNDTLDNLMLANAKQLFPLTYTKEEKEYAAGFILPDDKKGKEDPLNTSLVCDLNLPAGASTDVGDVSWNVPTAAIFLNCYARNSIMHSWQIVAQGKSSIAHKGMHTAAVIMAATATDLLQNPALIEQAHTDFKRTLHGETYASLIPPDAVPGSF